MRTREHTRINIDFTEAFDMAKKKRTGLDPKQVEKENKAREAAAMKKFYRILAMVLSGLMVLGVMTYFVLFLTGQL